MKKRKNFLLIIFIMGLFLIGNKVYAAEEATCKPKELSELRSMAANVKVTYVPLTETVKLDVPDVETGATATTVKYLAIKIYNINTKLNVLYDNGTAEGILSHYDIGSDGAITLKQKVQTYTVDYEFEITSNEYGCGEHTLRTIRLTLPRFNFYSQLDACADIPDYYLCQQFTTYEVDGATFYDKVDEYKAKLLTLDKDVDLDEEDNNSVISQAFSTVSKYKYIVVGALVVIGVVATIFILKRKKSVL